MSPGWEVTDFGVVGGPRPRATVTCVRRHQRPRRAGGAWWWSARSPAPGSARAAPAPCTRPRAARSATAQPDRQVRVGSPDDPALDGLDRGRPTGPRPRVFAGEARRALAVAGAAAGVGDAAAADEWILARRLRPRPAAARDAVRGPPARLVTAPGPRLRWCASTSTRTRARATAPTRPASWCTPRRRPGSTCSRSPTTTPATAGPRPPTRPTRSGSPWSAGWRSAPGWPSGLGLHLLAYLPDPTYPPLVEGLQRVLDGRDERVPAILERLREHDIDLTEAEVRRLAGGPAAVGRPHIADAMVPPGSSRTATRRSRLPRLGRQGVRAPVRRRRWSR